MDNQKRKSNGHFSFGSSPSISKMSSSSASSSSLTTCCICLERMKEPIRTLPCLHSSCSSCIDQLIKLGEAPFKCPQCRTPFEVPSASTSSASTPFSSSASSSLQPNYFTSHLLSSSSSQSTTRTLIQTTLNAGYAKRKKPRNIARNASNSSAQDVKGDTREAELQPPMNSIEEGLKIKFEGSASSSSVRITRCLQHPQQEINTHCEKCKEVCCLECSVDHHSGHQVVRLSTISQQFKGDISTFMNKVKKHDTELSQAIKETTNTLVELKKQVKLTEEHVHQVFDELRLLLDEREAELIGDVEKERHQKEKELMIQKDDLEFLLKGIRNSVDFSERLMTEGNGVEIAASHQLIVARFMTLENELKKTPLSPVTDEVIEFLGGEESKKFVKGIGAIGAKGIVSVEKSSIFWNENATALLNRQYSFDIALVDQKGNKVIRTVPAAGVQVMIAGPSKDIKVDFIEKPGDEGKLTVSFLWNQVGDHEVSILFKGRHIQGSPFQVKVAEAPVCRRDYGMVGNQPVVRFGSKGNGDGQISFPRGVACNSSGDIIVADGNNHRIQVFDKDGKFLFKFGSQGNGPGQFRTPVGVNVDYRNNNQIVVTDSNNNRIQIFDERGRFIRSFGYEGGGDGQLDSPRGVVVDQTSGNYFVADFNNARVQIFDSNGEFIRKFGSRGNRNGQFSNPRGIGLLSNGNVVVSEYEGSRLQIFDSVGNFIREIAQGFGHLCDVFVDSDDNILVVAYSQGQILVFKENGASVKIIGQGQLSVPVGICMDDQGRVIVSEVSGNQISIF